MLCVCVYYVIQHVWEMLENDGHVYVCVFVCESPQVESRLANEACSQYTCCVGVLPQVCKGGRLCVCVCVCVCVRERESKQCLCDCLCLYKAMPHEYGHKFKYHILLPGRQNMRYNRCVFALHVDDCYI